MTGPRDAVTDLVETIHCWRDSLRDRIAACGVTPIEFDLIRREVATFKRVSKALTEAIRCG